MHDSFSEDYKIVSTIESQVKEQQGTMVRPHNASGNVPAHRLPLSDEATSFNYSEVDLNAHRSNPECYKRILKP